MGNICMNAPTWKEPGGWFQYCEWQIYDREREKPMKLTATTRGSASCAKTAARHDLKGDRLPRANRLPPDSKADEAEALVHPECWDHQP
jgi:hypothetical protein